MVLKIVIFALVAIFLVVVGIRMLKKSNGENKNWNMDIAGCFLIALGMLIGVVIMILFVIL